MPDAPLSMITVPEDALVLVELDVLEELDVLVELDGLVELDVFEELDVLVELDEVVVVVAVNWTASAQVVLLLDLETITTFACPEKLYVPSRFHLPPFCN